VDGGLILETTFVIDLLREAGRQRAGPAHGFLEAHADDALFTTFTVAGEVASAFPSTTREQWVKLLAPLEILPCTADVCWEHGQAYRYLENNGILIGANDLWIAATAVAFRKTLVTRNVAEFRRVPGVEVVGY
jgi:predicted nucleic acid-binding protein